MVPPKVQPLRTAGLALLAVGCGALLGVSPPDPSDGEASDSGHGGAKTGGRAGNGGSGMGATGQGGTSSGAEAGEGSGGSPLGGASTTGGRATGGESAGNGGGAGDGGAGGEPEPVFPDEGSACSVPGATACAKANSPERLLCEAGVWTKTDECRPTGHYTQLCDRTTGTCGIEICDTPGPWMCTQEDLLVCGPDGVTDSLETCLFGCVPGDKKRKPACGGPQEGELLIDQPGPLRTPSGEWPNPLIPVCWRNPNDATLSIARAIRERIDTTWGRFSSVGFPGWGECDDTATGVELRFVGDCEGELASVPFLGYPGPSVTLPIDLCTSYLDSRGERQGVGKGLLGFVALHVFGHVLGFEDLRLDRQITWLMERVVEDVGKDGADLTFERFTLTGEDIQVLQYVYGPKPSHSLVGPNGRCLSFASGTPSYEVCDGSAAQRFEPGLAELAHVAGASRSCLRKASDNGAAVELMPCTGDASREAFLTSRVRWQVSRGRCAALAEGTPQNSSPLIVRECDSSWPSAQSFGFEFLGADKVRIHTATGQCVTAPNIWEAGSYPGLGTCGGGQDIFDLRGGRLGVSGQCLSPVDGVLKFFPCSAFDDHHFALTGPLALGSSALTVTGVEPPELTLTPLDTVPLPSQIFDYHL